MHRLGRHLVSLLGLAVFLHGRAFAQQKDVERPPAETGRTQNRDEADVSKLSKIEDASLEGLLDLDLEDQLGQTEAVSRTSESILRAPATLTTIDSTQIRLSGATTVAEVLRSVPGVAVFRSAPGNYVVALRGTGGLASNNVILLVDGIPLNNPLDGAVSWDLVPLNVEDVERIEVVRGPVSPIYGANAYTGVINIVTRTTAAWTPSYAARLRGGADANGNGIGAASGRFLHIGKTLELKWFMSAEHDGTSPEAAATTDDVHGHGVPLNRLAMTTALSYRPAKTHSLSFEVGQVWSRRSGMDHLALDSEAESRHLLFGRALYEIQDREGLVSDLRLWAQALSIGIDSDRDELTGFSYDGARSLRGVTGADLMVPVVAGLDLQLGGQGSLEHVDAPFIHPAANDRVRPAYGFYAGLKASPFDGLDLIAIGRGDLAPISTKLEFSYRVSAVYHTDTWGLRLTGASAFRAPSYVEATGRFVDPASGLILLEGSDEIGAPRNTSLELGAIFSPHSRLIISPTLYVSRLSNLMVEDFESVVRRTFRNDPDSRTFLGAEFESTWRVSDGLSVLPSFTYLYWIHASERIDTNVGVPGQNSQFLGGLRLLGLLGNETWGYGVGVTVASPRKYDVRTGVPPIVLSTDVPTIAIVTATLEHQLWDAPALWASLRLRASVPGNATESPLPLAAPGGQSAILGLELRRE